MDRRQTSQITTGLLLVALGLIFLGERLDLVPSIDLRRLWPVFLLVIGFGKFMEVRPDGRRGGGGWMMFLGVLFLLHTYNIFRLNDSWPLFIVAGGLSILFGRGTCTTSTPADRGDNLVR